ncbi:hypothetical protein QJQ45_011005 [Haematococcus lacustris]|nr:hypothetical protein QJQ45_011005 [Haematococcus lacustris]
MFLLTANPARRPTTCVRQKVTTRARGYGLQGLPAEQLDAVLSQLDERRRLPVFMTSKLLATALLRVVPRIQLTYPTQHDVIGQHLRELAPFLTEVLQIRQQPKLHLTLQPASSLTDAIVRRGEAESAAESSGCPDAGGSAAVWGS